MPISKDSQPQGDTSSHFVAKPNSYRLGRVQRSRLFRFTLIFLFVLIAALILPKDFVPRFSYDQGKTWVAPSLEAEFDFAVYKPESQIDEERRLVLQQTPPVFDRDTAAVSRSEIAVDRAMGKYFQLLTSYQFARFGSPSSLAVLKDSLGGLGNVEPDKILDLYPNQLAWRTKLRAQASAFVQKVQAIGYVDTVKAHIQQELIYISDAPNHLTQQQLIVSEENLPAVLSEAIPELQGEEEVLFRALVFPAIEPNLKYNPAASEKEKERSLSLISPVFDKVSKGEIIISKGERISNKHDQIIRSYLRAHKERFGHPPFLVTLAGQLVVVSFLALLLVLFLRYNRPRIYYHDRKFMLVLLVFLTMAAVVVLVLKLTLLTREIAGLNYIFLVPACMLPIILAAFFDTRFAFFANIVFAVFAGAIVPNGFEYLFIQLCGGTAAVYSLNRLRNRADFFISLSIILLTYMATYIGYNFYTRGGFTMIPYGNLALFGLNVMLTLITYPLIYVFEKLFGITSDLTFIELLDTNHPLLKDLSVKAPGTFQHSLQVANITEAVLNRIGGNSLQAKVGALFHDIGKMNNPLYFVENQADLPNPHELVGHEESAEIIIRHVHDGVRLAQEHKLPSEVVDYIRTHHGTTRVEFFYRLQQESHPDENVDPVAFTYPGPLPYTREMAVLMIADSIEAASRAMKDKSQEKLHALVESVVDNKVRQRQFIKAFLTFKDLEDAKQVILGMLVSIYHGRIEYPEAPADNQLPRSEEARDAD